MRLFRLILPFSLLAISGFAQDVGYNYDRGANFSSYKTYKWVDIKDGKLDDLRDKQVKSTIDAELAKKGLTASSGNADLLVGYQAAITQEKEFSSYSSGMGGPGWGYGGGWGRGYGYGYGGMSSSITTGQTSTIHIGNLGFDMYDSKTEKLVWRGQASKTINPNNKPDKQQKNLTKAVTKLLKNYPPPPDKK